MTPKDLLRCLADRSAGRNYFLDFFRGTPEMISSSRSFRVRCSFDLKSGAYIAARSALINLVISQCRKKSSFWNTLPCR